MRSTLISRRDGDLEAAPFHDLLSGRNCRRYVRLVSRARLGVDRAGTLGVLLVRADEATAFSGGRRKLIVGLYLVSAPVATIAWVATLARTVIWLVGFVLF